MVHKLHIGREGSKEIEAENSMQTYHFHRFIGESEDPLGSQESDRWIENTIKATSTAVFNGTIRQIGSAQTVTLCRTSTIKPSKRTRFGCGFLTLGWAVSNESNPVVTESCRRYGKFGR